MSISITPLFIAFVTTFIALNIFRPFAISINLVDEPSNRKMHNGSVPLIGGIAMYFGMIVAILTSSLDVNLYSYFIVSSLILIVVGVLDDHHNISVWMRFLCQAIAALIAVTIANVSVESFGNLLGRGEIELHSWQIVISVIAIITAINAVNMADGIHGLAGGNSLITFLSIIYLCIYSGNTEYLYLAMLFCAVLPAFLIENLCIFRPEIKRVFMGDAGSMLLGLGISWLLIDLSQGEGKVFSPVTALWLFALPLIEIVSTILRRLSSGVSPFKPDRYHFHHVIVDMGLTNKYALILILLYSSSMALIGVMGEIFFISEWKMFAGFLFVFLMHFLICRRASNFIMK